MLVSPLFTFASLDFSLTGVPAAEVFWRVDRLGGSSATSLVDFLFAMLSDCVRQLPPYFLFT